EDTLIRITVENRGPKTANIHVLPTLWFRDTWSGKKRADRPELHLEAGHRGATTIRAEHAGIGQHWFHCEGGVPVLFTENDTNNERIFGIPNRGPYVKDGINNYVVNGARHAVNPLEKGTKAAPHYQMEIPAGRSARIRLRLT